MITSQGVFIDIHSELFPYTQVVKFFTRVEKEFDRKKYCNGANLGGRWIYQIYSKEFIRDLAELIQEMLVSCKGQGPILEVMAGDGLLSKYIEPFISKQLIATDAKTSRDMIQFPKSVEKIDALEAIQKYNPILIIMSWEPYFSDISQNVVNTGIPTIWIGDPNACAVSSSIHEVECENHSSPYLLGRNDDFTESEFRTVVKLFNVSRGH